MSSLINRLQQILDAHDVPIEDNSKPLRMMLELNFRTAVSSYAFDMAIEYFKNAEAERRTLVKKEGEPYDIPMIQLMYYFEAFLFQLRIAMDFWAKFLVFIPPLAQAGEDFRKHRDKAKKNKLPDNEYGDYVVGMSWFDKMKKERNDIKSGKARFFLFDEKQDGYTIHRLYFGSKQEGRRLVIDYCQELKTKYQEFVDFVLAHYGNKEHRNITH